MAARKTPSTGVKSDKVWRDAVMRAVKRQQTSGKKTRYLEVLADKLVKEAAAGNVVALKEIGDRLDGKPVSTVAGDGENPLKLVVEIVD